MTKRADIPPSMQPAAPDHEYERLRAEWWRCKHEAMDAGVPPRSHPAFLSADRILSEYLWGKYTALVTTDRAHHPRARRNAPVGSFATGAPETPHIEGLTEHDHRGIAK